MIRPRLLAPRAHARPAGAGVLLAGMALAAAAPASAGGSPGPARATRALNVRDEGHLRYTTTVESELIDEGPTTGTLPGKAKVRFIYNGEPEVSARFTIAGAGGSFSGQAHGRLDDPDSLDPSFRGSLTVTRGTGRYAHVHGTGELFGVYYRRSYALVVQTIATLHY